MMRSFRGCIGSFCLLALAQFAGAQEGPLGRVYDPVVTDDSAPNFFVYPDAINLDSLINVVDDGNEIWSFSADDGTYTINGKGPSNDAHTPGTNQLNLGGDDPAAGDSNLRTLTIRNAALSPPDGTNINPPGTGVIDEYTKVITLKVIKDGYFGASSFLVYTSDGGLDHLSGAPQVVSVASPTVPSQLDGWQSVSVAGAPVLTTGENGLCIGVPLGIDQSQDGNFGAWISPYGILQLVQDNAYRVRIEVEANPAISATTTPLWDFVIDNVNPDPLGRGHKYGMDFINWDNLNSSANSAGVVAPEGRHTFDIWWTPMPVEAEDWNSPTGIFSPARDPHNDGRFQFRVLDVYGAVDAQNDAGTMCLKSFQIDRVGMDQFEVVETLYYEPVPVAQFKNSAGEETPGANMIVEHIFANSTTIANDGGVTIAPAVAGVENVLSYPTVEGSWYLEIVQLSPGDRTLEFEDPSSLQDNYPILWRNNHLLKYTLGVEAPFGGDLNPPDALTMTIDSVTNELGCQNILSSGPNVLGMPKRGPTTYTSLFYTHNKTASPTVGYERLRPRFSILCTPAIYSGGLYAVNNGGVKVTFMKVERLETSGF